MFKKWIPIFLCMLILLPSVTALSKNQNGIEINNAYLMDSSIKENTPPNPPVISGPSSGRVRTTYEYEFLLTDPDEDDFMFTMEIDFGDELVTEGGAGCGKTWLNGTVIEVNHQWTIADDYSIKAIVQDSFGDWSQWSEPFPVSMPKSKLIDTFEKIFNNNLPIFHKLTQLLSFV